MSQPRGSWRETLAWNSKDWLVVAAFTAAINLLMLVPTLYMLQVYDRVLVSGSTLTLLAVSLLALALLGVMAMTDAFRSRLLIGIGRTIDRRLAPAVFQATYRQRLRGEPAAAAQRLGDLTQVRQFLTGQGLLALLDLPWIPIYIGVLFLLHPVLGVTAILFGLLQVAAGWTAGRGTQPHVAAAQEASQRADHLGWQLLRGADIASVMGMTRSGRARWLAQQGQANERDQQMQAHQARWTAIGKWLRYTQQSAALGVGAWLVIRGELSAGAMIAGNVLTTRALAPIDAWSQAWASAMGAAQALERLKALLQESGVPGKAPAIDAATLRRVKAGEPQALVSLDGISVRFPARVSPALDDVTLMLRAGQVTVVQGGSGSGKTTLARVVLGTVDVAAGQVLRAPGVDVTHAEAIGYLPQQIELFEGTVAENIARFEQPDAHEVIAAAQLAGLHDIIQRLPLGYDTPVGAGGQFLSGGQRQRIALARAVYKRPPLVVLDEPNAQLDSAGEAALQQALAQLRGAGCAVLVISHRPAVLSVADQVLKITAGRVTDLRQRASAPAPVALAC